MKTKKIITTILAFVSIFIISMFINNVNAESLGYLTTIRDRVEKEITYRHQLNSGTQNVKDIWNIVTCNKNEDKIVVTDKVPDLYCLRAGLGFTQANLNQKAVEYNISYELPSQYEEIKKYIKTPSQSITIFNDDKKANFNAVMWILDHMLLEGATDEQVNTYLKTYAGYTDETLRKLENKEKENVLTRADIEVIQQLAIWHFTNDDDDDFKKNVLPIINMMIIGGTYDTQKKDPQYQTYEDLFNIPLIGSFGTERKEAAEKLYNKLITEGNKVSEGYKPTRKITVFLNATDPGGEQPIVRIKEREPIDVALRKYISAIDNEELKGENSREPVYDTSKLNKVVDGKLQTTAIYNHTKKPLKVSLKNKVTYTLRLYNEDTKDAYVQEVTDYLPAYLKYEGRRRMDIR